jgi:hypothetical protein
VAVAQENADVRPFPEFRAKPKDEEREAVRAALAWHEGDPVATIATLLADCGHLRQQLELTRTAMGRGFVRGWQPTPDRD